MRHFVIGTAGHVDHGKTTLVRALTGVDTDRLPEERARGISIELGFAPLELGGGMRGSVIDVPGHRRLVRTMIAGASGIDLVLLVVAADEGVMPQTREHVAVCELLGLDRAVVVVNKADAVDPDLAQLAGDEARALLGRRWTAEVVTCSARTGDGVPRVRDALVRALASLPASARREHVRLGVDRVFTIRGAGTVVTGTLVEGTVAPGDALRLVGPRATAAATARAVQVHDAAVERISAPARVGINLAGIALDAVARGDVVTSDPHLAATTAADLLVRGAHALKRGAAVTAHVGTSSTEGRVDALTSVPGGVVARVRLADATPLAGGDRMVLRGGADGPSGSVVGGGVIVDARPRRRTPGARRRVLAEGLATLAADATLRALAETEPASLVRADALGARFAVTSAALTGAAEQGVRAGLLAQIENGAWMLRARLDALVAEARAAVVRHHEQAPLERGLPLETLRERLAVAGGRGVAEEVIRRAAAAGGEGERLVVEGDVVRTARAAVLDAEARARVEALVSALRAAGVAGVSEIALAQRTSVPPSELRAALRRIARDGGAVRLGDLWFAAEVVEAARRHALDHFAGARTLTVIEFKGRAGLARRQAVLMLEHFDQLGLTRREGDARVLR